MLGSIRVRAFSPASAAIALLAVWLPAPVVQAQLAVQEVSIVAGRTDLGGGQEWFFLIEVRGADLTSAIVSPPTGGPLVLADTSMDGTQLEFEDGHFASFGELQAAHPAGDYAFTIEGSETVTLSWSPTEPVGASGQPSLAIDAPADGAVGVSATPDLSFTLDCSNCKDLNLEIFDVATGGNASSLTFGELDVVGGAFTNPIPFASMNSGGGAPVPLPDGLAEAELLAGLATFSEESFDMPTALPSFDYVDAAVVFADSEFTVPEPAAGASGLAALVAMALLARRRPAPRAPVTPTGRASGALSGCVSGGSRIRSAGSRAAAALGW